MSRREAWLTAMRPQTLPAGAAPVLMGIGLAVADGVFAPWPAFAALVGALLIQIGTNFANDYYDAINGADTADREGFTRVTAGGLIDPRRVRQAMAGTYALALVVGVSLVYVGGLPIVIVGLSSIISGILYTGGPYPYGYYGLGDLFVFVYFGLIAVSGTYYVQAIVALDAGPLPLWVPAETVTASAVLVGIAAGGLATTILVVNNIRDRETDQKTGKQTLAVLVGYRWSRVEYLGLVGAAYAVPVLLWRGFGYTPAVLLTGISLPLAVRVARTVCTQTDGEALNPALERTGQLFAMYALLFTTGLATSGVTL
ncbi:1,4-dihydroxy-2-naphthoate polyprenyltransferase [Halovenus rubra]|uniref:1,4-dihydroxy-2-naphthoate polyprenyltransferase n=2 Tax=Halovenus rubra TaxID=869890 RepID=A0ACC7E2L7_9EURY|nr:1,4-dihydroxy-2-naphthoate polyprenyltransferase [Halovenus rubra]